MVAGDRCTRNCGFCAVNTAKPFPLEADEPARVGAASASLKLRHVVVTMVARDDLADGASGHVAACVRAIREHSPTTIVELLTSDFQGRFPDVDRVLETKPDIFAHNLETVERTTPRVRSRATYRRSLDVLAYATQKAPDVVSKSGLMLGIGETDEEVRVALGDLRARGVQILTLGQYLQPSPKHLPVERWVTPAEFDRWRDEALAMGFRSVASGPLVRSSYYADAVNMEQLRSHLKFSPTEKP
jgi:lipoic acid synthetase